MNFLQTIEQSSLAAQRTPEQRRKRRIKAARTIIRLQHSLAADDEVDAFLAQEQEAITAGIEASLNASLGDVLGK